MEWTQSQRDAIEARRGTVLVAAAAGSGKTAVLVQRAVERLTCREDPTPANKMLIVTFTKAAAAEMRARLEQRLDQLTRENPGDPLLRRQSILLHQAHIGTVDSFCAEMVREFFHLLELPPDFKILSDKREEELTAQALEEALAAAYDEGSVAPLADAFAAERDDRRLARMVLSLYRFMQSHPFPERWLEEKVAMYFFGDSAPWEEVVLRYAAEAGEYCARLLEELARTAGEDPALDKAFAPALAGDGEACRALAQAARAGDWDQAVACQRSFAPQRRGALRGWDKEDPLLRRLEAGRAQVKKTIGDLGKCLGGSRAGNRRELEEAGPLLKNLAELALDFSRRYREKKLEKNFLDYSDLEHQAIRLFCQEDGSPTPTAREASRRFDEIMIDEYQDINEVQDSIFQAVSKNGENLFMVGDVKQSIYGFRRAMPEIFLGRRAGYQKYDRTLDRYPAALVLERNFRSRPQVVDSVNYVFSLLMSREAGDIDYAGEERLVYGADFPEKPGCETELWFLRREGVPAELAEASLIARRVRELVEGGFPVASGGGERPARYGDFCILLRSANKYAHAYAQELKRLGVPARATVSGGFFAAAEVQVVLSLLRVIDNPNQDIPLLAVLMSPLYGFSAGDTARLRAESREVSVYVSLTRAADEPACAKVLKDLDQLRSLAATMPADAFLTLLYGRTGYPDMVQAMEDGPGRLGNLRLLHQYAKEYEGSGYHGLSGFVRFLDRLQAGGSDLQAAEVQPGSGDAVAVMSIHKSKGLQFPVCIVAGCGRSFAGDRAQEVLLHPELGLGVKLKDLTGLGRATTTAREAIALEAARSAGAEELRVLYVAMTRAQEKLILVSSSRDLDGELEKAAMEPGEKPSPFTVRRAKNAGQWLMLCALRHPDGGALRQEAGAAEGPVVREDYTPWQVHVADYAPAGALPEPAARELPQPDPELYAALRAQADFEYPHLGSLDIPAKVAASKLAAEQEGGGGTLSRPAWMGRQGMTPVQRGIALHEFMQFADFSVAAADPAKELARLEHMAFLSQEQAEAVELERVRAFFRSPLGRRVLGAERVVKEKRFTAVIPAEMAQPGLTDPAGRAEPVVLQGSVDCAFLEAGRLHIIDFKTDRVSDLEELWQHYEVQLRLYAYAMEEVTGYRVGEMFLYSTWLNQGSGRPYEADVQQLSLFGG